MNDMKGIGARIKLLREMRGLSQKELAAMVGTKQPSISRYEVGRSEIKLTTLRRICKALDAKLFVNLIPGEVHEGIATDFLVYSDYLTRLGAECDEACMEVVSIMEQVIREEIKDEGSGG